MMNVSDILPEKIPTLDAEKFMNNLFSHYSNYPKNSISQREVVESINLGEISYEDAMKIADKLNAEVTKTIQSFQAKIKK